MAAHQEIPDWAASLVVGEGSVLVDGVEYAYHVMSRDLFHVKHFLGFPGTKFLFISEDVPEEYREHMLRHEVRDLLQRAGQDGRCLAALQLELAEVPQTIRADYIVLRRQLFRDLVAHYADQEGSDDLKRELAGSLAYLETL